MGERKEGSVLSAITEENRNDGTHKTYKRLLTNFLTVVVFLSPASGFKINHNQV